MYGLGFEENSLNHQPFLVYTLKPKFPKG